MMKDKEKTDKNLGKKISNLSLFEDGYSSLLKKSQEKKINLSTFFFSNQPLHIIFLFSIVAIIKYNLQIIVLLQNIFPDIPKLYLKNFRHV